MPYSSRRMASTTALASLLSPKGTSTAGSSKSELIKAPHEGSTSTVVSLPGSTSPLALPPPRVAVTMRPAAAAPRPVSLREVSSGAVVHIPGPPPLPAASPLDATSARVEPACVAAGAEAVGSAPPGGPHEATVAELAGAVGMLRASPAWRFARRLIAARPAFASAAQRMAAPAATSVHTCARVPQHKSTSGQGTPAQINLGPGYPSTN
eukprot:1481631-Pyramimonas_sp.AAC.1